MVARGTRTSAARPSVAAVYERPVICEAPHGPTQSLHHVDITLYTLHGVRVARFCIYSSYSAATLEVAVSAVQRCKTN